MNRDDINYDDIPECPRGKIIANVLGCLWVMILISIATTVILKLIPTKEVTPPEVIKLVFEIISWGS